MKLKPKKGLATFALLVILVLVYFFLKGSRDRQFSLQNRRVFADLNFGSVEKIEFTHNGKKTDLTKNGERFLVAGEDVPADEFLVREVIGNLGDLTLSSAVSNNKDKWPVFEVDDSQAIKVKIKSNSQERELWIGKYGPDFQSTYLRVSGDHQTYLTPLNLRNFFLKDDYRDLTVVNLKPEEVNIIEISYPNGAIKTEKKEGKWLETGNSQKELDVSKISGFLNRFSPLKAKTVRPAVKSSPEDFKNPSFSLKFKSDKEEWIIIGGAGTKEGSLPVKTDLGEFIYTLESAEVLSLPQTVRDWQSR